MALVLAGVVIVDGAGLRSPGTGYRVCSACWPRTARRWGSSSQEDEVRHNPLPPTSSAWGPPRGVWVRLFTRQLTSPRRILSDRVARTARSGPRCSGPFGVWLSLVAARGRTASRPRSWPVPVLILPPSSSCRGGLLRAVGGALLTVISIGLDLRALEPYNPVPPSARNSPVISNHSARPGHGPPRAHGR